MQNGRAVPFATANLDDVIGPGHFLPGDLPELARLGNHCNAWAQAKEQLVPKALAPSG